MNTFWILIDLILDVILPFNKTYRAQALFVLAIIAAGFLIYFVVTYHANGEPSSFRIPQQ